MATTVIIKAQVDTGNSAQELLVEEKALNTVTKSAENLQKTTKGLTEGAKNFLKAQKEIAANAAENKARFDELNASVEKGNMSFKEANETMEHYRDLAFKAGANSPIGKEAIAKAAELKQKLTEVDNEINNLGVKGRNLQAALQLGGTVVAGWTAFQGVTAMLGAENEELLAIMTKLQAATSTLQAIEQVRMALEKESFLMLKLKNVQLQIQEKGYKSLFTQLLKNPYVAIGAAVVGLIGWMATLISRESDYEKAVRKSKEATEALLEKVNERAEKSVAAAEYEVQALQASGKETQAAEEKKQALVMQTAKLRLMLLKRQRNEEQRAWEQQKKELEDQGAFGQAKLFAMEKSAKDKDSEIYKSRKELDDKIKQADADALAAERGLALVKIKGQKEDNDKAKKSHEDYLAKKKELDEKAAEEEKRLAQLKLERDKAYEDLIIANMEDGTQKRMAELQQRQREEMAQLIQKFGLDTELIKQLTEKQQKEVTAFTIEESKKSEEELNKEIKEKQDRARQQTLENAEIRLLQAKEDIKSSYQAQREILAAQKEIEVAAAVEKGESVLLIEEQYKQKSAELEKKYSDEKIAQKQKERDAIVFAEQGALDAIAGIGNLVIKNSEKAAKFNAIITTAQLALDTAKAIGSVIAGATAAAAAGGPAAPFLIAGYIASGIATVTTNMKKAIDAFKQAKVGNAPTLNTSGATGGASGGGGEEGFGRGQGDQTSTAQFFEDNKPPVMPVAVVETEAINKSQVRLKETDIRSTI